MFYTVIKTKLEGVRYANTWRWTSFFNWHPKNCVFVGRTRIIRSCWGSWLRQWGLIHRSDITGGGRGCWSYLSNAIGDCDWCYIFRCRWFCESHLRGLARCFLFGSFGSFQYIFLCIINKLSICFSRTNRRKVMAVHTQSRATNKRTMQPMILHNTNLVSLHNDLF